MVAKQYGCETIIGDAADWVQKGWIRSGKIQNKRKEVAGIKKAAMEDYTVYY